MKRIRELQARRAALLAEGKALTDLAAKESRDFTDDESVKFDDIKAQIGAVDRSLEAEQFIIENQRNAPAADVIVGDDLKATDPKRGFRSFGEFAHSVAGAALGRQVDGRLAAAPTTFNNESVGADGGFAIPPAFSQEIWKLSLGENSLIPLTQNTEVSGNSMIFPKDETTPWGGTGVQTYWQNEAKSGTESKLVLGTDALVLHKLMTLVPVTNELISDGFAIGSYLSQVAPERITWKVNEAILFGDGVGKPTGALTTGGPLVVQAKEAGQAAATINQQNLSKMVSRLLPGELGNAIWLGNPDVIPALEAMTVGNYPVYLPNMTAANAPYGMLKGRPLQLSEHAEALGSQGDINLLSLRGYRTITKAGGVETATSMHLYFDADATAFRFIFRINGKPLMSKPVTPPKSSNTRSHFVTLAVRA